MAAKGKKTAEYEAVCGYLSSLANRIQHNLHDLALKFFQEKLISKNEMDDACDEYKPKLPRTIAVLSSILDAIEGNKGVYGVFLAVLDEQADLDDMVKSIKTSYKSKSSESEKDSAFFDDVDHHQHPTYIATTHLNHGSELVVSGNAATSLTVPHSQEEGNATVITGLEGSFSEHSPIQTSDQFSQQSVEHVTPRQCDGQQMTEYVSLRQHYQQQKCELDKLSQKHEQFMSKTDDTIKVLKTRQMQQDRLIEKLKSEKAEYEKEIFQLKITCTKLIEEKNLAEQRANDIEQECQKKVDELQKRLQKVEEKEEEARIALAEIKTDIAKVELAKEKNTKALTKKIHMLEKTTIQLENDKTIITLKKDYKIAELEAQNAKLEAQHYKEKFESMRKKFEEL